MTAEHLLQALSTTQHPQASVLAGGDYGGRKLFGSLEDLRRMAAFVVNRSVHFDKKKSVGKTGHQDNHWLYASRIGDIKE